MIAYYDCYAINLSRAYRNALKKVLIAEAKMMQAQAPEDAACWYWGRVTVLNLANVQCVEFQYGAKEDIPDDGLGRFAVLVEARR